ncbi:rapamycin-insensitive companion of mTOR-like [Mytilus californianus]|uniref:rapamycin-insensitive companion of mTOR-like n=1 Tax=Mytilus californianus TaxID=6549 RepID=UPI002245414D|nr:rapamycin-insensitive companion of mTOR-like [Mytilus californianus]
MAAVGARQGIRSHKTGRFKSRNDSGDEVFRLDFTKGPTDNLKEILVNTIAQIQTSKSRKLGYLNAFVKFLQKYKQEKITGYSKRDILSCLRISLFHEAKEVRAATLRVLRYFIQDGEAIDLVYALQIDYLIVRSVDVCLDNEVERIHAIKLIRKIAHVAPQKLSSSLVYPLVAIGNDGNHERDRMVRISLATICEIAFLNPELLALCGGISTIIRAALDCHQYPRINESLVSTILYLLNHPRTRHLIKFNTDLEQLLAPFTDCHYRFSADSSDGSTGEDKEHRFASSKMAVIAIMKSWPGILRFCRPDGSGLQSIVGILYLPFPEIRQGILDILYDLFRLQVPEFTENFSEALLSVDQSVMKDTWRLTEGFVAEEGKSSLPHMAKIRPNLVENHLALILFAWIGAGILEALVEVIISSSTKLSIRATILLGELLHLASTLLPHECSYHNHCLPSLLSIASSMDVQADQRNQAQKAVYYLDRFHSLKKKGVVPCSLYLDQLIQYSSGKNAGHKKQFHLQKDKLYDLYLAKFPSDDIITQAMRDSMVVGTKNNNMWNWDLISSILKWPEEKMKRVDDQIQSRFIKRLVYFFKPTNHIFSRQELKNGKSKKIAHVGCLLIDFLISCDQDEAQKQVIDFLNDIGQCLSEISSHYLAPESVLSPSNIQKTCSQYYFLMVGRFSCSVKGDRLLEKTCIYQYLMDIVSSVNQDSYVKLTVSSLNYSRDNNTRHVLAKALSSSIETSRLYTTNFLRVLLRSRVPGFSTWGMELIVTQLYDKSTSTAMAAIALLEEACEVDTCLNSLLKLRPSCLHLGDKGVLLLCRLLSTPKGFKTLLAANYVTSELLKWRKTYNAKYVNIVEERLNEALTTYEKTYEGSFTRRSSQSRPKKDAFLPVHLYGELVQHKDGFELLKQQEYIEEYFECVKCQYLITDEDETKLKTALWVVGHIGTSTWGIQWLEEECLLPEIIKLAEECGVFSLRGTAFYVLGLLASTREGAQLLSELGYESCWRTREEMWPVVEDKTELLDFNHLHDIQDVKSESNYSMAGSIRDIDINKIHSPSALSSSLFFIEEEGKNGCDSKQSCDKNSNFDSSAYIPHKINNRVRTLPHDSRRANTLPLRPQSIRSVAVRSDRLRSSSDDTDKRFMEKKHATLHSQEDLMVKVQSEQKTKLVPEKQATIEPDKVATESKEKSNLELIGILKGSRLDSVMRGRSATVGSVPPSESTKQDNVNNSNSKSAENIHRHSGSFNVNVSVIPVIKLPSIDLEHQDSVVINRSPPTTIHISVEPEKPVVSVKKCNFRIGSDEEEDEDHKVPERKKDHIKEASFNLPSYLKESKGNSSDSSKTSKSRTDSFNTDSTTSGIGSLESGAHCGASSEIASLSPIASSSSLENIMRQSSQEKSSIHPSINRRRSLNLNRIPSLRKSQASPAYGILPSSRMSENISAENAVMYTTTQDALGYSTWRSLRRQRTYSSDMESELGIGMLYGEDVPSSTLSRQSSIESKMSFDHLALKGLSATIPRNSSTVSLQDQDRPSSPFSVSPKAILLQRKPHTGKAEFLGLTLPVDINMIFEVHEGEDKRSHSGVESRKSSGFGSASRHSSVTTYDTDEHETAICIVCHQLRHDYNALKEQDDAVGEEIEAARAEVDETKSLSSIYKQTRTRLDSCNEPSSATPGSVTSMTSNESSTKKIDFESVNGRTMLRKEVKKFVVSLSSFINVKSSEQGLLTLKQKVPKAFQDLCFFSEVIHILGTCSFRLTARRFIQELFDEFDMDQILQEAKSILGVNAEIHDPRRVGRQENLDSVWEKDF